MAKNYTVIELSELLNVPRTTINDWLARHAQYIESVTLGKRRVFTEHALDVLKEVADLRNRGLSSAEISEELAKRHPVQAEVADKMPAESAGKTDGAKPKTQEPAVRPVTQEEYSLMVRQQSEELSRMLAGTFSGMTDRLAELEQEAKLSRRRLMTGYVCMFVMLFLLVLCAVLLLRYSAAHSEEVRRSAETGRTVEILKENSVSLSGSQSEMKQGIAALNAGLAEQKKELNAELQKLRDSREAEMILLKEQFAQRQKEYLEKIEQLSRMNLEAQKKVQEASAEVVRAGQEADRCRKALAETEKKLEKAQADAAMKQDQRPHTEKKKTEKTSSPKQK